MKEESSICCICVEESKDLKSICDVDSRGIKYADKLTRCAAAQKWLDTFEICPECLTKLNEAYQFIQQCVRSEELRENFLKKSILIKIEEDNNEFKCPLCPQTFTRKSSVKRHINTRHTGKVKKSQPRRKTDKKPQYTEEEIEEVKDETEPELETDKTTEDPKNTEEKSSEKPKEKPVIDSDDDYNPDDDFPDTQEEPESYEVSVYNGGDYYCDYCPQTFTRRSSVKRHVLKQHTTPPPSQVPIITEFGDVKNEGTEEDKVPTTYKVRKRRVLVKKKLPPKGPIKCTHCPKLFNRRDHWNIHIRNNHTFERPYACDQCESKFTNSVALLMHKRNHKNERPFVCDACGKNFVSSSHLANHKKIHQNKRSYRCEKCGKGFNMSGDLKKHNIIVHTDSSEWTHVCNICSKRFPLKAGLDNHVKRHMGIRDYICHICSKNFIDNNDLNKHIRTHSDNRVVLPCTICKDKIFKTKDGLAKHLKSNHNIGNAKRVKKKYPCTLCSKIFSANYKLHKHVLTHASGGSVPSWEDAVLPLFMPKSRILQPNPSYV